MVSVAIYVWSHCFVRWINKHATSNIQQKNMLVSDEVDSNSVCGFGGKSVYIFLNQIQSLISWWRQIRWMGRNAAVGAGLQEDTLSTVLCRSSCPDQTRLPSHLVYFKDRDRLSQKVTVGRTLRGSGGKKFNLTSSIQQLLIEKCHALGVYWERLTGETASC